MLTAGGKYLRQVAAGAIWMAAPWIVAENTAWVHAASARPAAVRFALTFDDGPSGATQDNPTAIILATLSENSTHNGIKTIFFVQPRSSNGGATPRGPALLAREHREGHVLALHDGSTQGHRNHRKLSDGELEESLRDGVVDLLRLTGRPVTLLRPPNWSYDERTLAVYARHGLAMLLTDISANDGKTWGFHASPRRRSHMAGELARVREAMMRGEIPAVEGVTPIIVTFHDTNAFTAAHMRDYLQMLVDEARSAGIALAARPFYDETAVLERAALARARDSTQRGDMVPWQWRWFHWWFGHGPSTTVHLQHNYIEPRRSDFGWLPL